MEQDKPRNHFFTALSNIFHNQIDCSVIFKCPKEPESTEKGIIGAHKMILSLSSEVFRTMFFGEMSRVLEENEKQVYEEKEETNLKYISDIQEIEIEDITLPIFKLFLSFIYGDETTFKSTESVMQFFYTAHKYMCHDAIDHVVSILISNIKVKNVVKIYNETHLFENKHLENACFKFISENTDKILNDQYFVSAVPALVEIIFGMPKLRIDSELDLVRALERYIEHNPKNADKMRPALNQIHFLTLNTQEIINTSLLTPNEIIGVISSLKGDFSKMPPGLSTKMSKARIYVISDVEIVRVLTDIYSSKICFYCHIKMKNCRHPIWSCTEIAPNLKKQFSKIYQKYKHVSVAEYVPVDMKALYDIYNELGCFNSGFESGLRPFYPNIKS